MPYQSILSSLLADAPEALGVVFVDDEGETVGMESRESSEVEMRITGAYLSIYWQRVVSLATELGLGSPGELAIERSGLTILTVLLTEGYCLGLLQASSRGFGRSHRHLLVAAERLEREVLSELTR